MLSGIALRRRLHADEDRALAGEGDAGVGALRRQFDRGDVFQPHEAAVLGLDGHALELVDVLQVGIGRDVGDDEIALGLPGGGLEVVRPDRHGDVVRRYAAPRHPRGVEPDPHREGLSAENFGRRHAIDGGQDRLHHARQIVRYRRSRKFLAGESEIHHGGGLAGRLQDDRIVGLSRNQVSDRIHLRHHFGQRLVGIEVELDVDRNQALALGRGRGDVVDAFGGRHRLLDRRGDEALHQVRRGAGIDRRHRDHGVRQFRILPDRQ